MTGFTHIHKVVCEEREGITGMTQAKEVYKCQSTKFIEEDLFQ